jgi:hypothetical protein
MSSRIEKAPIYAGHKFSIYVMFSLARTLMNSRPCRVMRALAECGSIAVGR